MEKGIFRMAAVVAAMAAFVLAAAADGFGCSRAAPFQYDELFKADVIVRATAQNYVGFPIGVDVKFKTRTTGVPESKIEFTVEEVLRGKDVPERIELNGYLSKDDDFNDQKPPYTFVRQGGRSGSCFANTYRQGAPFLLFLKKAEKGYTPNISALGPVNEQLRGVEDPWLLWVRDEVKKRSGRTGD